MSTLPLSAPSPTSGFHSSYYLGVGWGIAEAVWGIVQGYEQLALYEDVMRPSQESLDSLRKAENGPSGWRSDDEADEEQYLEEMNRADEAELERKVEILERMRARRDLEAVIGVRFPVSWRHLIGTIVSSLADYPARLASALATRHAAHQPRPDAGALCILFRSRADIQTPDPSIAAWNG